VQSILDGRPLRSPKPGCAMKDNERLRVLRTAHFFV
jgi:hypothetical protein